MEGLGVMARVATARLQLFATQDAPIVVVSVRRTVKPGRKVHAKTQSDLLPLIRVRRGLASTIEVRVWRCWHAALSNAVATPWPYAWCDDETQDRPDLLRVRDWISVEHME